jgi:AAA domain
MKLQQANRKNVKIKMGLQGSSGCGKSQAALLIAFGITNDWSTIAVIDSENHSSELYSHFGNFNMIDLVPPFSPERYIEAIKLCEQSDIEVIIIDSISLEWDYIIESHGQLAGNSYTNWSKFTPRHQAFINAILQSNCHVICTIRSKQDYVLNERNGKFVPEKVGMKPIQRDGVDYELTLVFEIDIKHNALATKDRTGLFSGKPEFKITSETGKQIIDWCNTGLANVAIFADTRPTIESDLDKITSMEALKDFYFTLSEESKITYKELINNKKQSFNSKYIQNGTH